jgi:hypothetical protein
MFHCRQVGCGLIILGLAAVAQAQDPFEAARQFSATIVMSGMPTRGRQGPGEMKVYRSGDKMRTNMAAGGGYMLMDLKGHTNYLVTNGMCMQMSTQRQTNPFLEAEGATVERTPAGFDTVDGHACKVENLTITPHDGQPTKMKAWEARDLNGFPVKIEVQSSRGLITIQYKDVSLKQPDPSLFTHPDNCQQMPVMPGQPR